MARSDDRRTPTLSVSLTPELVAAVDARVRSGMYSSPSEVLREALRLLLQVEPARTIGHAAAERRPPTPADRLSTTFELIDFGTAVHAHKLRRAEPDITDDELQRRRLAAAEAIETDDVIRPAPERLARLRVSGASR
jgi:putative addiction module CopG family antidote